MATYELTAAVSMAALLQLHAMAAWCTPHVLCESIPADHLLCHPVRRMVLRLQALMWAVQ
jgi:hypothetical protein